MKTIVIEVSGGVVQEVYTDAAGLRIVLVDWDKGESPEENYAGGELRPVALAGMPDETRKAASRLAR